MGLVNSFIHIQNSNLGDYLKLVANGVKTKSDNWDTLLSPGCWYVNTFNGSGGSGYIPSSDNGFLSVFGYDNIVVQIVWGKATTYTRLYNGVTWSDWKYSISNADLPILTVRTGTRYWTQYTEVSGQKRIYFYNADFPSGDNLLGYIALTK